MHSHLLSHLTAAADAAAVLSLTSLVYLKIVFDSPMYYYEFNVSCFNYHYVLLFIPETLNGINLKSFCWLFSSFFGESNTLIEWKPNKKKLCTYLAAPHYTYKNENHLY